MRFLANWRKPFLLFTRLFCIAAFQGCPCPMQSCPKNVDTGALIGNGKGAPVVSGPGLSLPPSALVGPPSPARGLAGLAPPHGANAWDTDRVQINTHRNLNQNQPPSVPPSHNLVGGHSRLQNQDCRSKVCCSVFEFYIRSRLIIFLFNFKTGYINLKISLIVC